MKIRYWVLCFCLSLSAQASTGFHIGAIAGGGSQVVAKTDDFSAGGSFGVDLGYRWEVVDLSLRIMRHPHIQSPVTQGAASGTIELSVYPKLLLNDLYLGLHLGMGAGFYQGTDLGVHLMTALIPLSFIGVQLGYQFQVGDTGLSFSPELRASQAIDVGLISLVGKLQYTF